MLAYLLDGESTRKIRYASQAELLRIVDAKGLDLVMWWPPNRETEKDVYCVWMTKGGHIMIIHRVQGPSKAPN